MQSLLTFNDIQEARSKVTSKGQVTIPQAVRQALSIKPGDQLVFHLKKNKPTKEIVFSLKPSLTLEETFASVKPTHRPEDFKHLREIAVEEKSERELQKSKTEV